MRAIPTSLDPTVVAAIDARFDGIERDHGVRIAWAIESGSRAWGFPSPDSDYDARFIYIRDRAEYLTPWPRRDVIETPLDKVFDVNGWDLMKALRLLVKGNGTVTEWLRSPIVYRGDEAFRAGLLDVAEQVIDRPLLGRHYLHVGLNNLRERTSLKKFFYILRPAAVLRWMRDNPDRTVPPMQLQTALAESTAPRDVVSATEELIALKSGTRELGSGEVPSVLRTFVETEFADAEGRYEGAEPGDRAAAQSVCEEFLQRTLSA